MAPSTCCVALDGYFPFIERIFADGGYRGERMALVVVAHGNMEIGNREAV